MPSFDALVDLCRAATTKVVAGTDLVIRVAASDVVAALVTAIEAGKWRVTVKVAGREFVNGINNIDAGVELEIIVHGMVRTNPVVVNNVGGLLSYGLGQFLASAPDRYFVLQDDYASGELKVPLMVDRYLRCIEMVRLLALVADDLRPHPGTGGKAMILTARKLDVPIRYRQWVLDSVPSHESIESSRAEIFDEHLKTGRLDSFKRVLVRFLFDVAEEDRFEVMVKSWPRIMQAFRADFDIYASGFNFDKAREEFERRKLDFVVKMNAASSDAMGKLIAIPVGQGLLASQMKTDASYVIVNVSLLVASVVFFIVAALLIVAHVLTIRQVGLELSTESNLLRDRARPTYDQLRPMIDQLKTRIAFHKWLVPAVMALLLLTTTAMTVAAYLKLTA